MTDIKHTQSKQAKPSRSTRWWARMMHQALQRSEDSTPPLQPAVRLACILSQFHIPVCLFHASPSLLFYWSWRILLHGISSSSSRWSSCKLLLGTTIIAEPPWHPVAMRYAMWRGGANLVQEVLSQSDICRSKMGGAVQQEVALIHSPW